MKINWKQKLSSRKLWAAVVGVVVGLAAAFGIETNEYAQIAGIVTSAVSVVAYIFGEAKVDSKTFITPFSAYSCNTDRINIMEQKEEEENLENTKAAND